MNSWLWPGPAKRVGSLRRKGALGAVATVLVSLLAACGGASNTINWFVNPSGIAAYERIASACEASSNGAYKVNTVRLPFPGDGQREVLVRLLASANPGIDVFMVDPPYHAELADAGWLQPFTESQKTELLDGVLEAPIESAMWRGKLYGVPFEANTQLLWYKRSVAEEARVDPTADTFTWEEMLAAALRTGTTIAGQANDDETLMVWVNAMILSAGGHILEHNETGRNGSVTINSAEGREAATMIRQVAISKAATPTLSESMEEESRASFEQPDGGFMLNWPYVYPYYVSNVQAGTLDRSFLDDLAWARFPRVRADIPSRPPLGGNNLVISRFSSKKGLAYQFLKCALSPESEKINLLENGWPPANGTVYDDPEVRKALPMADLMRQSINAGGPRPVTPFYRDISAAIQRTWHPPAAIHPATTPAKSHDLINDILQNAATTAG
jgi:multiple sugar transport system substrate-binding protein